MGMSTRHLRFRVPSTRPSVTIHHMMNSWHLTTLLVALLSTANGNRPPDDNNTANYVTQNHVRDINVDSNNETQTNYDQKFFQDVKQITDANVDTNYETQTNYDSRQFFQDVTQNGITDANIDNNYETQTNYDRRQFFQDVTQNGITDGNVDNNYETQTNYDSQFFQDVAQNGITDAKTDTNYKIQTTNSASRQVLPDDDIMSNPTTASLTSSSVRNKIMIAPHKPSTALTPNTEYDSKAITYPMTQTESDVDDKITTGYTSSSKLTKMIETSKDDIPTTTTHFAPTTPIPVDACDTESLEVTSTLIHVMAITRYNANLDTNCSLHVTAPNNTAISVQLTESSLNNISTYFYIEYLGHLPQNCTDRYIAVSTDHTPCAAIISGNQFRLHFQNSDMLVEVHASDVQISKCFDSQSTACWPLQCKLKPYAKRIQHKIEYKRLHRDWPNAKITRYLADCTCNCPCMCTLGYKKWLSTCHTDGKDINTTRVDLIVYMPNIKALSFANTGLNAIQGNAFLGFRELEVLILEDNNLSMLPPTICQNLPKLQVLILENNMLTNLTSDLFKGQCEHQLRWINLINNTLTFNFRYTSSLTSSVFGSLGNLRYLHLSDNNIAALPAGVFDSLGKVADLKLSDNNIAAIPVGVFDSLHSLSFFELTDNNIAAISAGMFNSLGILRHLKLSDNNIAAIPVGVFDLLGDLRWLLLSDNNIAVIPAGVFDSLYNLKHLHLSNNNIAAIPAGVFASLRNLKYLHLKSNNIPALPARVFRFRYNLRYLDLSNNNISALPAHVFASLRYLGKLHLHNNNIAVIPAGVFNSLGKLRDLYLSNNNISSLHKNVFTSLHILQILDVSHNVLHNLLGDVFKSLQSIKVLDLSHNAIKTLPSEIFAAQHNLDMLDLSSNNLSVLPTTCFSTLEKMIVLKLCCNNLIINDPQTFASLTTLQVLDMGKNNITQLPKDIFSSTMNLVSLNISDNNLKYVPAQCFANLSRLIHLNLSKNSLFRLPSLSAQGRLKVLDLSENSLNSLIQVDFINVQNLAFLLLYKNNLVTLPGQIFYHMNKLIFVNVSYNAIQKIGPKIFSNESKLQTFDIRQNEMYRISHDSFLTNPQNATIIVDKYATCCFMDEAQCVSIKPRPEYLTCRTMLQDVFLRISVWVLGLSAFICNGIAYYVRSHKRQANKIQTLLISHLALADLLMGVNMLILASADVYYGEFFPSYAHLWRQGFACKLAGFLSIFSSEGSVFFIVLISIDRLLGIKYPFGGGLRLESTKWARVCVVFAWLMAFLISVIPIALATDRGDVFSISEVCIGIPIVRRHVTILRDASAEINTTFITTEHEYEHKFIHSVGSIYQHMNVNIKQQQHQQNITYSTTDITGSQISPIYSIVVFIGINLVCFFIVAFCYMYIFIKANETSEGAGRTLDRDEQVRMAKKMFAIVFTDFCCWVPLSFICILVQCGVMTVSPEMYAWTVGFILPINSSINPFLYVLYETISEHLKKKREEKKTRENIEMQVRWKPLKHFGLKFDQNE